MPLMQVTTGQQGQRRICGLTKIIAMHKASTITATWQAMQLNTAWA
jgi:hypothetical protein